MTAQVGWSQGYSEARSWITQVQYTLEDIKNRVCNNWWRKWDCEKLFSMVEAIRALHSSTLAWKIPWMEEPGRLQSMGSLELDTTERLHSHFSLSCIGEGNGNPLQCSCLENPRDGGAWWAAVYGVAQSWTWLKRLSSSSRSYLQIKRIYSYENIFLFPPLELLLVFKFAHECYEYLHTYIRIYICVCVCVCVSMCTSTLVMVQT